MKKNKYRFISVLLAAELIFNPAVNKAVNVKASVDDVNIETNNDFEYVTTSGGVALLGYIGDSEDVVLPDEINGKKVNMISSELFNGKKDKIKSVTLGTLGGYYLGIFDGLKNLENIYVNENNKTYTSLDGVLYDKEKLILHKYPGGRKDKDYTIIDGVTSLDYIAFSDAKLDNLYIPNSIERKITFMIDENTNIVRAYSVSDITFKTDDKFTQNVPINICVEGSKLQNSNIEGLIANINIQGEDGFTKEIKGIKVDKEGKANTSYIFPKNQKYKITANLLDGVGKCASYSKDIDIVKDNFSCNMSINPKTSGHINENVSLLCDYGNDSLYSFSVEHNGKTEVIKEFSKDNFCEWAPSEGGIYSIYADVKMSNGITERRTLCSKYLVSYDEYAIDDLENHMYKCIINNNILDGNLYVKGLESLNEDAKEYLRYIAWDTCFHKDVIAVNNYLRISYNNKIYRINLPYSSEEIIIKKKVSDFKNKYISHNMTELEKELAVVKYLKDICEYDNDAVAWKDKASLEDEDSDYGYENSYNAYGALQNGLATCKGYAEAAKILLNSVGIECSVINSNSLNHVWNIVKIDGEYYELDVTWIDTTSNGTDNDFFNFSNEDTRHNADDISNMDLYNKCTSTKYDNFVLANYNPYLRKMINFTNGYFSETDAYGNNYDFLFYNEDAICYSSVKFSTGKVASQYSLEQNNEYFYYCTKSDSSENKYEIKRINLKTYDMEVVATTNNPCKLKIVSNNIIVYNDKETKEIPLDNIHESNYYSVIFKDGNEILDTQYVNDSKEIKMYNIQDKEGYSFEGWSIDNSSLSTVINNSDIGDINNNMVLTAIFTKICDDEEDKNNNSTNTPSDSDNTSDDNTSNEDIKASTSTVADNEDKIEEDTLDNKPNKTFDNLSLSKYGFLLFLVAAFMVFIKKAKLR